MSIESLPIRQHRAVSEMRIVNKASSALSLERLRLPTLGVCRAYLI